MLVLLCSTEGGEALDGVYRYPLGSYSDVVIGSSDGVFVQEADLGFPKCSAVGKGY